MADSQDPFKVLIALDISETSQNAFDYYFNRIHRDGNELILVHCPTPPKLPTFSFASPGKYPAEKIAQIMTDYNKQVQDLEDHYTKLLWTKKITYTFKMIDNDESVAHRLVKIAEETKASLIVLGSQGHVGVVKRTLLQSVSEHVNVHSNVPVLIVHKCH